jgi:hypothetical protein
MTDGPEYNIDSAALKKCRHRARKGLAAMSRAERQAYGAAVHAAVLSAQRAALKRAAPSMPRPNCASGTTHNTGEAIHNAIREQQRAALAAYAAQVRRARTPDEWREMYDEAMAEKRQREAQPPVTKPSNRRERAEAYVRAARARLQGGVDRASCPIAVPVTTPRKREAAL